MTRVAPLILLSCFLQLVLPAQDKPSASDAMVICSACKGTGNCSEPGCDHGQVVCPNTCLKKEGPWKKMKVPGHSDDELWQEFIGPKGGCSWTQAHIGQLIQAENGTYVNKGTCPTCNGTGKVSCEACGGSGVCSICKGAKSITKDQDKQWKKQAKDEATAKAAWETVHSAESKAGEKRSALEKSALDYSAIFKKFPETRAGRKAKADAERLAAQLNGK